MKTTFFLSGCILTLLIMACQKNKLDVDVSKIKLEVTIQRLDQDLFALNPDSLATNLAPLEKKYGEFFLLYTNQMIKVGDPSQATFTEYLRNFLIDYVIQKVKTETEKRFPGLDHLKIDLTGAFRHYKYYYPDRAVPRVFTCISGFNQSIVTSDSLIGISLDKYLGPENPYYYSLQLSKYLKAKMYPQKIAADCILALGYMEFPYNDSADHLLSNMIYHGKIQYFVDALMPEQPDTLKMGYSQKQWKWCVKYEGLMWKYMIEKKMLFINDPLEIKKFVEDGPFTAAFGQESPSRTGAWLGWQIVKSYMENHPETTVPQLMKENDYQKILNLSHYKP